MSETASDLVVMLSIVSSLRDKVIPSKWIAFGEVGLTGEVRPVYNAQERLSEAQKQGFELAIIPKGNQPKKSIKRYASDSCRVFIPSDSIPFRKQLIIYKSIPF